MSKNLLKLFLFLWVFLLGTAPAWAQATSGTTGGCNWSYDSTNKKLTISKSNTGNGVTGDFGESEAPWNSYQSVITSVKVEEGVTRLGSYCFYNCTALTNVTLPNSLVELGFAVFKSCTVLANITLPSYLQKIGDYCFQSTLITTISIPASVTIIGNSPFYDCSHLTTIEVDDNNSQYADIAGVLIQRDEGGKPVKLICFPGAKEGYGTEKDYYEIPNTVTIVGASAFYHNNKLNTVVMHSGVETLDYWAFRGFWGLKNLICLGDTPAELGKHPSRTEYYQFQPEGGQDNLVAVYVPTGKKTDYENAWLSSKNGGKDTKLDASKIKEFTVSNITPIKGEGSLTVYLKKHTQEYNGSSVTPEVDKVLCDRTCDYKAGSTTIATGKAYTPIELTSDQYNAPTFSGTPTVGTPITVTVTGKDAYSGASGTVLFNLTKATVTVKAKDHAISYGDALAGGGYIFTGFKGGDTDDVISNRDKLGYTSSNYTTGSNVGTYAITPVVPADLNATNYKFVLAEAPDGVLTVNKKDVTVSGITADNKEYDGTTTATLILTNPTFTGIVSGDNLTVTAPTTGTFADANVGTEKTVTFSSGITLGGTSVDNYKLAASGQQTSTTANITAKPITVTANSQTVAYNSGGYDLGNTAYTQTGDQVAGHTITVALNAEAAGSGDHQKKITPTVTIKSGETVVTSNYSITCVSGILTETETVTPTTAWSTYYWDVADAYLTKVDGLTPYTVTGVTTSAVTTTSQDYIQGQTPYLLNGTANTTYTLTVNYNQSITGTPDGQFKYAATAIECGTGTPYRYVLNDGEFIWQRGGTIPAGKCYIQPTNPSFTRSFGIEGGDGTTDLSEERLVNNEESATDVWYDMQGRRLSTKPTRKGVYVKNGNKVVIK